MSLTDYGAQATVQMTEKGVNLMVALMSASMKGVMHSVRAATQLTQHARESTLNTGKMSVKRLHNIEGGGIQHAEVPQELRATIQQEMRRAGVNYSLEKAPDGRAYLHFSGNDLASVEHGLKQAQARITKRVEQHHERDTKLDKPEKVTTERLRNDQERAHQARMSAPKTDTPDMTRKAPTR